MSDRTNLRLFFRDANTCLTRKQLERERVHLLYAAIEHQRGVRGNSKLCHGARGDSERKPRMHASSRECGGVQKEPLFMQHGMVRRLQVAGK